MSVKTIKVFVKQGNEYSEINGKVVMPFTFGRLRDERLDEAYLNIVGSTTKEFKPYTPVRVDFYEDNSLEESTYYIIARDNGYENPIGINRYRHEIYLIERTKWLEAFYCQSLTFTNPLGNNYKPTSAMTLSSSSDESVNQALRGIYVTPLSIGEYLIPTDISISERSNPYSAYQLGTYIAEIKDQNDLSGKYYITDSHNNSETKLDVIQDGSISTYKMNESPPSLLVGDSITLRYTIVVQRNDTIQQGVISYTVYSITYQINGVSNQLPLKPYTINEVINRVLSLAETRMEKEQPRFKLNAEQEILFDNIISPEFSMTQCTLREALKVIGAHIHKEPRLGWYNPTTEIYEENTIVFDDIGDATTESSLVNKESFYNGITWDGNDYCTSIVSNAANLVNSMKYATGVITEPGNKNIKTVRTDNVNVLISDNSSTKISTALPIYSVQKIEGALYSSTGTEICPLVDITPYLYEKHEYDSILTSYGGSYPYSKSYGIYYTQGSKNIDGLFFKPEDDDSAINSSLSNYSIVNILNEARGLSLKDDVTNNFANLAFRVTYIPIYSTRLSHGKALIDENIPVEKVYSQGENQVEARYFGNNIKGVAARLGNVEQSRTYILGHFSDIPRLGYMVDGYSISAVNCSLMPNYIKCTVALSKDYNRINEYIGINSHKRVFEVSEKEVSERTVPFKDYIVITESTNTPQKDSTTLLVELDAIRRIFDRQSGTYSRIDSAISGFSTNNVKSTPIILPVVTSALGNAMVFSWSYKDNFSAGESVVKDEYDEGKYRYWQTDVPYSNNYGIGKLYEFSLRNQPYLGFAQARTCKYLGISENEWVNIVQGYIKTPAPYVIDKDSREAISCCYEIEYKTDSPDIIIGSALASSCDMVAGTTYTQNAKILFFNTKLNKFGDTLPSPIAETTLSASYVSNNTYFDISASIPSGLSFKSWAIVTPTQVGETKKYIDRSGNIETITETTGNEMLIGVNKDNTQYNGTLYLKIYKKHKI